MVFVSCQNDQKKKNLNKIDTTKLIVSKPINEVKVDESDTITIEYLNKYNPYDFETKLQNGYFLDFKYYKNFKDNYIQMCLTLNEKNKVIDTLNVMGYGAPHKNLGYIGADFKEYFAFVNSYGSGNPHEFRLIRKFDGKVMTKGFIVDSFEKPEILLFAKGYDSLMVRDIQNNRDYFIEDIQNSKNIDCMVSSLTDVLKIKSVSKESITIEINNFDQKPKIKIYPLKF